jgi:hypothetical protein
MGVAANGIAGGYRGGIARLDDRLRWGIGGVRLVDGVGVFWLQSDAREKGWLPITVGIIFDSHWSGSYEVSPVTLFV